VSPILGIIASQNYPRVTNSYESIATVTVGSGGAANIQFTSIPGTYTHLQIRGISKDNLAGTGMANCPIFLNGDTTSTNYSSHELYGDGSSATSGASTNAGRSWRNAVSGQAGWTGVIVDILDYANTNKYKTLRTISAADNNGTSDGVFFFASSNWRNTDAITSVRFNTETTFMQYSHFALYGIKGA